MWGSCQPGSRSPPRPRPLQSRLETQSLGGGTSVPSPAPPPFPPSPSPFPLPSLPFPHLLRLPLLPSHPPSPSSSLSSYPSSTPPTPPCCPLLFSPSSSSSLLATQPQCWPGLSRQRPQGRGLGQLPGGLRDSPSCTEGRPGGLHLLVEPHGLAQGRLQEVTETGSVQADPRACRPVWSGSQGVTPFLLGQLWACCRGPAARVDAASLGPGSVGMLSGPARLPGQLRLRGGWRTSCRAPASQGNKQRVVGEEAHRRC